MAKRCRKALVEGRVQGVFFRGSIQLEAAKLGITGYAINRPDGCTVEVVMCGEKAALDELQAWLHQGSRFARVDRVTVSETDLEPDHFKRFTTG